MRIASLAAKALHCRRQFYIVTNCRDDFERYLLHLEGIICPVHCSHTAKAQQCFNGIATGYNRPGQNTAAEWIDTLESPRWVISLATGIGAARHEGHLRKSTAAKVLPVSTHSVEGRIARCQ